MWAIGFGAVLKPEMGGGPTRHAVAIAEIQRCDGPRGERRSVCRTSLKGCGTGYRENVPIYRGSLHLVAYLGLADNSRGPLLNRLRGFSPPVVRSQNGLSAPYAALLSCLSTHRSCLLTYRSRAVGRSFSWFICNPTWGCGQGGTR